MGSINKKISNIFEVGWDITFRIPVQRKKRVGYDDHFNEIQYHFYLERARKVLICFPSILFLSLSILKSLEYSYLAFTSNNLKNFLKKFLRYLINY